MPWNHFGEMRRVRTLVFSKMKEKEKEPCCSFAKRREDEFSEKRL